MTSLDVTFEVCSLQLTNTQFHPIQMFMIRSKLFHHRFNIQPALYVNIVNVTTNKQHMVQLNCLNEVVLYIIYLSSEVNLTV